MNEGGKGRGKDEEKGSIIQFKDRKLVENV